MIRTLTFEDCGQDFLEWDIDENNTVVACRPSQGWVWIGSKITNKVIKVGNRIRFKSKHMQSHNSPNASIVLKYRLIKFDIQEVTPC